MVVVDSAEEAAGWVKAVSICLPPRASGGFYFSTLESPAHASAIATRVHLICVLRSELSRSTAMLDEMTVLDAAVDVEVGTISGEPHVLGDGTEVPAGEWSEAVFDYLAPGSDLSVRIDELASVEKDIAGQASHPAWWLWACNVQGDSSALDDGARLLARCAPPDVDKNTDIMAFVDRAMALTMGSTAAERWAALDEMRRQGTHGVTARSATEQYLALALADAQWLREHPALPLNAWDGLLSVPLGEAVEEAVRGAHGMSPDDRILVYVRLLDAMNRGEWTRESDVHGATDYVMPKLREEIVTRGLGVSLAVEEELHHQTDQDLADALRDIESADAISRRWLERLGLMRVPDTVVRDGFPTPLDRWIAQELLADLVASGRTARTSAESERNCNYALVVLGCERDKQILSNLIKAEVTAEQCAQALRHLGTRGFSSRIVCAALLSADPMGQGVEELLREMRSLGRTDEKYRTVRDSAEAVRSLNAHSCGIKEFHRKTQVMLNMLAQVKELEPEFKLHPEWNGRFRISALCCSLGEEQEPLDLPAAVISSRTVKQGRNAFWAALGFFGSDPLYFVLPVRVADRRYETRLSRPREYGTTESGVALSVALAQEVLIVLVQEKNEDIDAMIEGFARRTAKGSVDAENALRAALNKWVRGVPELPSERLSMGASMSSAINKMGRLLKRKDGER